MQRNNMDNFDLPQTENVSPENNSESPLEHTSRQFRETLESPKFIDGYVGIKTAAEQQALSDLQKKIETAGKRKISAMKDSLACEQLGVSSVEEGRKKGKEWGATLKAIEEKMMTRGVTDETGEVVGLDTWSAQMIKSVADDFALESEAAEKTLKAATEAYHAEITGIKEQFEVALKDLNFQQALEYWRESPTKFGATPDAYHHSGLVHFVEYRTDSEKSKRIDKLPEGFSPRGFIDYTERLRAIVNNPRSEEVEEAVSYQDTSGRQRLLILMKDGYYISSFRDAPTEHWRMITYVPDFAKQWEKTKKEMGDVEAQKNRRNKLEGEIREIPLD